MRRAPRALAALAAFFAVTAGHRLHSSAQLGTTTSLADRYLALSADPDHHAKKSLSLSAVARTTSRGHAAPQLPGTGEAMQPSSVQLHGKPEKPWEMAAFRHANTFHTLRICNAYPYDKQMRILLNEVELFGGMEYKECDDFANLHLTAGDQLRFLTEVDHHEKTAGIFEISQIPKKYSTTLVLIAQRSNGYSNSMKFESHIFRHDGSAQIAVIDTVRGEPRGKKNKSGPIPGTEVSIEHRGEEVKHSEPEQLPYGSVHKINSGLYNLVLKGNKSEFVALPTHDYVVLRVGVLDPPEEGEPEEPIPGDKTYDDELVIFPLSDSSRLQSTAAGKFSLSGVVLALFFMAAT